MKKFNLLKGSLLVAMTLFYCYSYSQIPAGYYDPASGLTGDQLKAALHSIIDGHTTYPYSSSGTDTWDILKEADRDPQNPNNVIGIYSGFSMDAAAEYAGGAGWNREHVWAKSRGDFGTTQGAGTDVHHLRAADVSTNSARSNRNFDYGDTYYVDGSGNYSGATLSKTSSTNFVWEPRDVVKGDVARMIFYMVVRYEGTNGDPDLELTDVYQTNTSKEPLHAKISTLIEWHLNDPVDDAERARNEVIYGYQQNRNPFIDHPEYVCEIYPSYCSNPPPGNNAPTFTSTAITSADEGQAYAYNISTNDIDGDALTITAATQPSWLAFTDNGNGTASLSGTPGSADVGAHNVVLNVNDGTASTNQSFTITVNAAGTGGGDATELFFSEYIEGSSYNKGLELANFTGASINLAQYSIQKQTNGSGSWGSELVLSGTLANADVYVVVHSSADAQMQSVADLSTGSGPMSFNGNDAIGLFKNGTLIDVIGTFNDASNFAQDVTLVRKSTINTPTTTYTPTEWDQYATNTFSDLGIHTFDAGTPPPSCDTPTGLSSANATTSSIDLSWTSVTEANSYNIEYRVNGTSNWTVTTSTVASITLTGLAENTTYEYRVASDCGSLQSAFTTIATFTTTSAATCDTPTGLSSSNATTSSVDINWTGVTEASSYVVEYRTSGSSVWSTTTSTVASITLTGLTESTTYEYRVASDCGSLQSAFTTIATFTTTSAATCDTPTGLTSTNITSSTADLSWSSNASAIGYGLRYRVVGTSTWNNLNASTNSYSLTNLLNSTNYEYQVRTECGSLNSTYASSASFTTLSGVITYCGSTGNQANEEWIQAFTFHTINNTSGSNGGYADFTALSASVVAGSSYSYSITPEWSGRNYNEAYNIWIDFNQNGDFNDAGEEVVVVGKTRDAFISGSITIPANAMNGPTRMRVTMKYNKNASSCETFSYGEVEDYTINISGGNPGAKVAGNPNSVIIPDDEKGLVYPNPVRNRLNIGMPVRNQAVVKIFDTSGQLMKHVIILEKDEALIDTRNLKAGLYLLHIEEEGNLHKTKFIVE